MPTFGAKDLKTRGGEVFDRGTETTEAALAGSVRILRANRKSRGQRQTVPQATRLTSMTAISFPLNKNDIDVYWSAADEEERPNLAYQSASRDTRPF
jgi:hypothetical protein